MAETASVAALLLAIGQSLADAHDRVRIEIVQNERFVTLVLHVDKADLGEIIGKQGRTARAIRFLLAELRGRDDYPFPLDIRHREV